MPKNNAKPWENGGKGNGKKRNINGRTRRPSIIERNKTDKLSKERFLKLVWRILKISKLFKWYTAFIPCLCIISAKVRYCGASGEEVQYDKHRCNDGLWKVFQKVSQRWNNQRTIYGGKKEKYIYIIGTFSPFFHC